MERDLEQECGYLGDFVRMASAEDTSLEVKGIVWLEHINLVIGDTTQAEAFYFEGLGLTRDPSKVGSTMWANVGRRQQLHLVAPALNQPAQVIDGSIGLALPDLAALRERLASVANALRGTLFVVEDFEDCLAVRCPWGNTFFIYPSATSAAFGEPPAKKSRRRVMEELHASVDSGMAVRGEPGIRFVHIRCKDASSVGRFYSDLFGCPVCCTGFFAAVGVGPTVHLVFESKQQSSEIVEAARKAQGVHICIYISDFKRTYDDLQARGLIWTNPRFAHLDSCNRYEEAAAGRQYRFKRICDRETKEELLELEHETRSLRHLQFMKEVYYILK